MESPTGTYCSRSDAISCATCSKRLYPRPWRATYVPAGSRIGRAVGAPEVARVIVPQIESFARTIAHWIVRPRRKLILAAVDRPGVASAFGGRLKAECGIGDDVDPRRRRRLARSKDGHILLSISRKAAEPVEEFEIGRRERVPEPSSGRRRAVVGFSQASQSPECAQAARSAGRVARQEPPAQPRAKGFSFRPRSSRRAAGRRGPAGVPSLATGKTGLSAPESRWRSEVPGHRRICDR